MGLGGYWPVISQTEGRALLSHRLESHQGIPGSIPAQSARLRAASEAGATKDAFITEATSTDASGTGFRISSCDLFVIVWQYFTAASALASPQPAFVVAVQSEDLPAAIGTASTWTANDAHTS